MLLLTLWAPVAPAALAHLPPPATFTQTRTTGAPAPATAPAPSFLPYNDRYIDVSGETRAARASARRIGFLAIRKVLLKKATLGDTEHVLPPSVC